MLRWWSVTHSAASFVCGPRGSYIKQRHFVGLQGLIRTKEIVISDGLIYFSQLCLVSTCNWLIEVQSGLEQYLAL